MKNTATNATTRVCCFTLVLSCPECSHMCITQVDHVTVKQFDIQLVCLVWRFDIVVQAERCACLKWAYGTYEGVRVVCESSGMQLREFVCPWPLGCSHCSGVWREGVPRATVCTPERLSTVIFSRKKSQNSLFFNSLFNSNNHLTEDSSALLWVSSGARWSRFLASFQGS